MIPAPRRWLIHRGPHGPVVGVLCFPSMMPSGTREGVWARHPGGLRMCMHPLHLQTCAHTSAHTRLHTHACIRHTHLHAAPPPTLSQGGTPPSSRRTLTCRSMPAPTHTGLRTWPGASPLTPASVSPSVIGTGLGGPRGDCGALFVTAPCL